jgi:hypothetical protein
MTSITREIGTPLPQRVGAHRALLRLARQRMAARCRPMARVGYIGALGAGNLGDDAMFDAAKGLLPTCELIPLMAPWQERRLAQAGLSGPRFFDSVVLGGGTLINPYWVEKTRAAVELGLRVWTLGTGVGSSGFEQPSRVDIQEWQALLQQLVRIGVRGPRSRTALAKIGIRRVEVVGDLALSLAQDRARAPSDPPSFAVNVALPEGLERSSEAYQRLRELEGVLGRFVAQGWQPVPVAMHPSDVTPLRQLLRRISRDHLPVPVMRTAHQFFQMVGACRFTVGVRLHAAILSCCVGVPPLMLGYREKCLDFMESMQLAQWHVALDNAPAEEIATKVPLLSRAAAALRPAVLERAQIWKRRIEEYVEDSARCPVPGARRDKDGALPHRAPSTGHRAPRA